LQRADLITGVFPWDRAALEGSFTRFLDRLQERFSPVDGAASPVVKPLWWLTAVVTLEAARRWRRRVAASRATESKRGSCSHPGLT